MKQEGFNRTADGRDDIKQDGVRELDHGATLALFVGVGNGRTDCKRIAGHGNWLPWLDREFGWAERTAQNFISVCERI